MQRKKEIIVYTAGTWDLFHIGHLNILKRSKKLGTKLIVGVNPDELVKAHKGLYPIIEYRDRVAILEGCKYVDKVVKQTKLTDIKILKRYKVDIVTVADDWKGKYVEGNEWAKKNLKLVYFPYTKRISTTYLKERIKKWLKKI